jgi:hypothetical protein
MVEPVQFHSSVGQAQRLQSASHSTQDNHQGEQEIVKPVQFHGARILPPSDASRKTGKLALLTA